MNESQANSKRCAHCGVSLENLSVEGVCPRCMLSVSLSTSTKFTGGLTGLTGGNSQKNAALIPPSEIAPHFPQLDILECLGRGGMGVVYKARQKTLDRLVALKILAPGKDKDPLFANRFAGEATALARLNHQNIVTIYDFGRTNGFFFLLMEFVDGANLRQVLQGKHLSESEALAIISPVCDALQYAHDQGIVHRDIKPENLLLDKHGRLKIADFGISKMIGAAREDAATEARAMGTPHYMAPEQFERPQDADHRTDVYSVGVLLYELLTGELPSPGFQSPSRKAPVDARLDGIVERALNHDPTLRFQYASEVKTCIDTIAGTSGLESYTQSAPRKTTPSPFGRLGWLFFLFAGVTLVPAILGVVRIPGFNENFWAPFNIGTLTLVTGIALLTGSARWRIAALTTSAGGILAALFPLAEGAAARMAAGVPILRPDEIPDGMSLLVSASIDAALIASLRALLKRQARSEFTARKGLPVRWPGKVVYTLVLMGAIMVTTVVRQLSGLFANERLVLAAVEDTRPARAEVAVRNQIRVTMPMRHVATVEFYVRSAERTVSMTNLCAVLVSADDRPLTGVVSWEKLLPQADRKKTSLSSWRVSINLGSIPYPVTDNLIKESQDFPWRPKQFPAQPINVDPGNAVDVPIFEADPNSPHPASAPTQVFVRVRFQSIPGASKYQLPGGFGYTTTNYPAWLSPPRPAEGVD